MNLLSNFNEFTQQFQWIYSAISMFLRYHHVEIRAQKNCFMFQTKVALLIKTIYRASHFTLKVRVRSPYISSSLPLLCILIQFVVDTGDVCRKLSHSRRAPWDITVQRWLSYVPYYIYLVAKVLAMSKWKQSHYGSVVERWSNGGRKSRFLGIDHLV